MRGRPRSSILNRPGSIHETHTCAIGRDAQRPGEISSGLALDRERTRQLENNLFPLNGYFARSLNPDSDRVAVDLDDRYSNVQPQSKTLAELPAQDKHGTLLREPHQIKWIGSAFN